ncbi:hypothetical protein SAMN02745121_03919 [Nannocystis exedens]|uniref:Uncharacterized protein n=1 Tax=Nannocystis exedens TaxID=54 RepID=A0A1I1ZRH9_9BACT|nr:hypothetical protein [Nannocystis exedens]PCC75355.1 hypothetical protein NAEX_08465 [Nannocystis exedens]SFE34225.1 hypothetical protein SAMN02745121_03919 [Nannocystis exedens]
MPIGDPQDLRVRALTEELIHRLRGFIAGRETPATLQQWAQATWGKGQEGPVAANRLATEALHDLWNADSRFPPGDLTSPPIFRPVDAAATLRRLTRGSLDGPVCEVAALKAPLHQFAARLDLETERHVLDGLGWFEFLQFASPGTGRAFDLQRPLERRDTDNLPTLVRASATGDAQEILQDLFETLVIDHDDVAALADDFAALELPKRTLWRQDDNGNRAQVASFTGVRKAEAALTHYAALMHKQLYWLE